ncbi:hypothetical protein ACP70R_030337 [Stipagrostis hirtigluma subsp. patula]
MPRRCRDEIQAADSAALPVVGALPDLGGFALARAWDGVGVRGPADQVFDPMRPEAVDGLHAMADQMACAGYAGELADADLLGEYLPWRTPAPCVQATIFRLRAVAAA